jgi:glycosyltransferase involved in cell wall biosynthesis
MNLTSHVKLLDFVPQEDLPALYRNATFFIYPSFYEGFGLPVLEAMNQGTPVITSKISSLPEVGVDSVLYCNPKDIHDIAMVMRNLLKNKDLRETLSRRSRERSQNFSMEGFVEKVMNIILSL